MFLKKKEEVKEEITNDIYDNQELLKSCKEYFDTEIPRFWGLYERGLKKEEDVENELKKYLKSASIKKDQIETVIEMFKNYVWGYSIIDDLINDDDISDIKIVRPDCVRIKKKGKRMTSKVKFEDAKALKDFVYKVAIKNKINLSDINAIQTFTDKTTNKNFILRINISTSFVNSVEYPYLHIRKIPKRKKSIDTLIKEGLATSEQFEYLKNAIKEGRILIFCGKGASGKTTMMNVLLDEIPYDKSGLVIQENEELFSNHPDLMFQRVRYAKGEGRVQYSLKDLSINGLLIDLDWYIIGEIKGGEALYFLNAGYTGHACMASVHGASSTEAINKLIDYMKYESDYTRQDLQNMLKGLKVLVVFMKNYNCKDISELIGYDHENDELIYKSIFKDGKRCE